MHAFNLHTSDLDQITWKQHDFNFSLKANEVHIWLIEIAEAEDKKLNTSLLKTLNSAETERMLRFKKQDDQRRFLYAHSALRLLCSKYLGQPSQSIIFTETINKKPCIEICFGNLFFNLSHSGLKVLIAFSNEAEVGVDIEQIRPDFKIDDFMERNYSDSEKKTIASISRHEQLKLFFKYWSRKEAWLKATGIGIFSDLTTIDTALPVNRFVSDNYFPGNIKDNFYVYSFQLDDYCSSIVLNKQPGQMEFLKFNTGDFL